jgi:Histone deacetylase domain
VPERVIAIEAALDEAGWPGCDVRKAPAAGVPEHIVLPALVEFAPQLVLVSAGFDGHRDDPLADCLLEAGSYAQMTCHVRDAAASVGAPVGAVLEGGYHPGALAESVLATVAALDGRGRAESIAPDLLVTSRAAAHVGHFWTLSRGYYGAPSARTAPAWISSIQSSQRPELEWRAS